jgi:hypothetical protein
MEAGFQGGFSAFELNLPIEGDELSHLLLILHVDVELGISAPGLGVADVRLGCAGVMANRTDHSPSAENEAEHHDRANGGPNTEGKWVPHINRKID